MELQYTDAYEIARLIRAKEITCRDYMQFCYDQIRQKNPGINAIIELLDEQKAMDLAKRADEGLMIGENIGPLHGIPVAVKEMTDVKGWASTYCWKAGKEPGLLNFDKILESDGFLAQRMRRAGMIFIGKTNMPEFALGSHTTNDLYGITRNPYNLSKSAGGSSGGAAAALASGMLPLADGSDLGGSLRNPAAFCNVIGFRPSIGRVPAMGKGWAARISTEGPMARSVRDIGLLLSVQAGPHSADPLSIFEPGEKLRELLPLSNKKWKIGWTLNFGRLPVDSRIEASFLKAVKIFQEIGFITGHEYPDLMHNDPGKNILDAMSVFRIYRSFSLADKIQNIRKGLGVDSIRKYCNSISQYEMIDAFDMLTVDKTIMAIQNRNRIYQLLLDFFDKYDFLVCPTTQAVPFDVEMEYAKQIGNYRMADYLEWMTICCILSLAGMPVISMPAGFTDNGLPVGIQIVGKPRDDLSVLQLAKAFEEATKFSSKYKPPEM